MDNREFCLARRKDELPAFLKVLKAIPEDKQGYRPDPKARTAGELAWVLATEEAALLALLDEGTITWKDTPPPPRVLDTLQAFEKSAVAVNERLAKLDEAGWTKKGSLVMQGMAPWETSIGEFLWGFLFDEIHHRGQLSTYLRPMGSKVPAIYGPSADDSGG